jgi:hypothetical protein
VPVVRDIYFSATGTHVTLAARYTVPYGGNQFEATEHWTLYNSEGQTVVERSWDRTIEPEQEVDPIFVPRSYKVINRWRNNIAMGEYIVELVVEAPEGNKGQPARRQVEIEEKAT